MKKNRFGAAILSALMVSTFLVAGAQSASAATATGKSAVRTQLQPQPKITGVTPLLWIPASKTLTLQCLAVGEKAYGAVASANPYYYKTTYGGKTGYVSDSDLYTAKDATKLGLTYCSIPAQPGSPSTGSITSSSVTLSWVDKSNNETSFKTQYSTDGGKTWRAGPTASANAKSIKVSGLSASKKYTFQVGASNNKGTKWSAYVTATTSKTASSSSGRYHVPFAAGETWYVCQGYSGTITHSNDPALDLTFERGRGADGCWGDASASAGKSVYAPISGKLVQVSNEAGGVCITPASGGGSIYLGHLSSRHANGNVTAGEKIGVVAAPYKAGNNGYSHVHLSARSGAGCGGSKIPFDDAHSARIKGVPNMTASGAKNQWAGTTLKR